MSKLFSKTAAQEEELGTYYLLNGEKITLHYYGGFMSYSDYTGDYLASPALLDPYVLTERYQVQVGTRQVIKQGFRTVSERVDRGQGQYVNKMILTDEPLEPHIVEEPVYESRIRDITPAYVPFGSPIQVGDLVKYGFDTGELLELADTHFVMAYRSGKRYVPWRSSQSLKRA